MKGTFSTEMKVGIFALLVLGVLTYMTFMVSGREWFRKQGYHVYVYFSNTAGLEERSKVKIAGVEAGLIDSIELEGSMAKVRLLIYPEIKLYRDTVAVIKSTGLLGDKYLELRPGSEPPVLRDGDMIRRKLEPTDMDQMIQKLAHISDSFSSLATNFNDIFGSEDVKRSLKETALNLSAITKNLNRVINENDKRLKVTLQSIRELVASLNSILEKNRTGISSTINNLNRITTDIRDDLPQMIKDLRDVSSELKALVKENGPRFTELTKQANETMKSVKSIARKIEKGQGTLGKLVNDESLYTSVNNAVKGIERTINRVERLKTFITFKGEYLTDISDSKGYFNLTIKPRPDKYYIIGIVSDPIARVTTKKTVTIINGTVTEEKEEEETEKEIEFTAQFARRFQNTAFRLGLTENTFGFGVDQFFNNDRLKVSADIWDFGNDEEYAKNPHLKVGLDYNIYKGIFLSTGVDNILNSRHRGIYFGGGVTFEDEDFKYLLGTMPRVPVK